MFVLQDVKDVEKEGFLALIGQNIEVWCGNYIYAGKLIGVNTTCIKLQNPHLVFETGGFMDKKYKDAQNMGKEFHYLQVSFIESFGVTHKLG